jgi:hypothetical protein
VRATGRSWLQATTAEGKELFQGVMQAGEVKTFTDKQRVKLVVGNAGAVALTVNGTEVGAPGRSGQVARVQFGPQDPAAGCSPGGPGHASAGPQACALRRHTTRSIAVGQHVGHDRLAHEPDHGRREGLVPRARGHPAREQGNDGGHLGRHPLVGRPPRLLG